MALSDVGGLRVPQVHVLRPRTLEVPLVIKSSRACPGVPRTSAAQAEVETIFPQAISSPGPHIQHRKGSSHPENSALTPTHCLLRVLPGPNHECPSSPSKYLQNPRDPGNSTAAPVLGAILGADTEAKSRLGRCGQGVNRGT